MNILALDCATRLGWATLDRTGSVQSGLQVFDLRRGESAGMRWLRFTAWLHQMHELDHFNVIAYEQAHHRGGAATAVGVGFTTCIDQFAAHAKIETMPVHTATIKKHATGRGNADKQAMIAAARGRGWSVTDDNVADALFILDFARRELRTHAEAASAITR